MGVIAYAFLANSKLTRNRPPDEHRFQVKYGNDTKELQEIWQDPHGLLTTILLGINPEEGFFVAADPVLHNPTYFFISIEFKDENAREIQRLGWTSWERSRRTSKGPSPIEVLIGGKKDQFLQLIRFERAAQGLDPGQRQLVAERMGELDLSGFGVPAAAPAPVSEKVTHQLAEELLLGESEIFDLIASAPRLKMALRGWVAEEHLRLQLAAVPGVEELRRLEQDKGPDLSLRYCGSRRLLIECKNVLRKSEADGSIRMDFQRTRASKADPCSRYYKSTDFDLLAACLHSRTEKWEFRFILPGHLPPHRLCQGRLSSNVKVGDWWLGEIEAALRAALQQA